MAQSDVQVETLMLGWIRVRKTHLELPTWMPGALRQATVLFDPRLAPPVPVNVYLVRTGDIVMLVDTGEVPEAVDAKYFRRDPILGPVQLMRFTTMDLPASRALVAQLAERGLSPSDVTHVVLSHLHFDHAGTLAPFESAEILVSRAEVKAQSGFPREGAHVASWPSWFPERATQIAYDDGPFSAFDASHVVGGDERIRVVPTPGHTSGHQSVLVADGERAFVFAGDATFTLQQLMDHTIPGMTSHPKIAVRSNDRLREAIGDGGGVYLPAHDPDAEERLLALGKSA